MASVTVSSFSSFICSTESTGKKPKKVYPKIDVSILGILLPMGISITFSYLLNELFVSCGKANTCIPVKEFKNKILNKNLVFFAFLDNKIQLAKTIPDPIYK